MIDIRGNNHAPTGDFIAHQLGHNFLAGRHILHFFGDYTVPRIVHLGEIAVAVLCLAVRNPLRPWPRSFMARVAVSVVTISVVSVAGRHDLRSFDVRD